VITLPSWQRKEIVARISFFSFPAQLQVLSGNGPTILIPEIIEFSGRLSQAHNAAFDETICATGL
jgi:hypothetical protein